MQQTRSSNGTLTVRLPQKDGGLAPFTLSQPRSFERDANGSFNRIAFSAAHVVSDPLAEVDPWLNAAIDWDSTIAYREYIWDLGLGVAEAMDTAQRGMGLDWNTSLELIRRSVEAARPRNGLVFSGAGTDQLALGEARNLDDVIAAYEEQIEAIEKIGGRLILMASRALAAVARGPEDYFHVYDRILRQVREPVIIHWLGEMFDPALAGYWGNADSNEAMDSCVSVLHAHRSKVDGIKISLLSKQKEIDMRRRLPDGVRMYTGDDFNYPELIAGDDIGYSDALLGIFDAIAPAAAAALAALGRGSRNEYFDILEPTVPLSRQIFASPTRFYKTGIVFLAYLNGHQNHFTMVGGQESARSTLHLAEVFRLADAAGLLNDPARAANRMRAVMATRGIEA
jgi:hypothetical protein